MQYQEDFWRVFSGTLQDFKMAVSIGSGNPDISNVTLILIYFSGITLNMISLGGLALG